MNIHRCLMFALIVSCGLAVHAPSSPVPNTPVSGTNYFFPDLGATSIYSDLYGPSTTVGYGIIRPAAGTMTPPGLAVVYYRAHGVLVCPSAVPAGPAVSSGRTYAEHNGPVRTGIAFANPANTPATISFYFTDSTGVDFGTGSFTLAANAQIAAFVDEAPLNAVPDFTGSFTFSASSPVGVTALRGFFNERSEFLVTAQPVASINQTSTGPLTMAHFADGAGWTTSVELLNTSDTVMNGDVQFYDEGSESTASRPITLTVNGRTASSFLYSIAAHGSVHLDTAGSAVAVQTGSVRVTPDFFSKSPSGQLIFSYVRNGVHVTEAPVAAEPTSTAFRMYVQTAFGTGGGLGQPNSFENGIAITNTSFTPTQINIELFDLNGASTGLHTSLNLSPLGHTARFLHELFPSITSLITTAGFRGLVRITSSSGPVSVIGLLAYYNERSDFLITTMPASDETVVPDNTPSIIPQVVIGGGDPVPIGQPINGYFMQFIVFSGSSGQSANGGMGFFTQKGAPFYLFNVGP